MRRLFVLLWLALAWQAAAQGAVVRVGFADKAPPFSMARPPAGIQVDVFRAALAVRGHTLEPVFLPVRRLEMAFRTGQLDALMTDVTEDVGPAVFAEPAIVYDNVFISLKSRQLQIDKPADLQGLRVMAFPGARGRFPAWLTQPAKTGHYTEQGDQYLQVTALQSGRYDVVLSDRSMFRYHALKYAHGAGWKGLETQEHNFLSHQERDYRTAFHDRALRDDFETGLRAIKQDGRYKAIYDHYLQP